MTKSIPTSTIPALYKSFPNFGARTVGFDHLLDMMDHFTTADVPNYPPYNIVKVGEDKYEIIVAAAGFSKDDISIEHSKNELIVKSSSVKEEGNDNTIFIYKGLAKRDFILKFKLADDVEVNEAMFENGLLTVKLQHSLPEEEKPKLIPIL